MGRKLTPEEAKRRAEEMKEKSTKLSRKADAAELAGLVDKHLDYSGAVLKYAKRIILMKRPDGILEELVARSIKPPSGHADPDEQDEAASEDIEAPQAAGSVANRRLLALGDAPATLPSPASSGKRLDRRYRCLEEYPVKDLKSMCTALNRVSLSPFALRGLVKRGQRDVSQSSLCEIIEYETGVDGRQTFDHCDFDNLGELIAHLQRLGTNRGNRAKDLIMPPNWDEQGVYFVQAGSDGMYLHHRFDRVRVLLPPNMQQQSSAINDYSFHSNYSERRAEITYKKVRQFCMVLLQPMSSSTSAPSLDLMFTPPKRSNSVVSPELPASRRVRARTGTSPSLPRTGSAAIASPTSAIASEQTETADIGEEGRASVSGGAAAAALPDPMAGGGAPDKEPGVDRPPAGDDQGSVGNESAAADAPKEACDSEASVVPPPPED